MLKRMRIAGFLTMLFIFLNRKIDQKRLFRRTRPREPSYSSYMIRSEATKSLAPQKKMRKNLIIAAEARIFHEGTYRYCKLQGGGRLE